MMAHFAALEQRLGERTAKLLADATMSLGALSIDGMLAKADQLPQFGQVALQAKAQAFVFATALIGATPLSEGDLVTITKNAVAKQYRIGMRVDLEDVGQTVLELKRAAA